MEDDSFIPVPLALATWLRKRNKARMHSSHTNIKLNLLLVLHLPCANRLPPAVRG